MKNIFSFGYWWVYHKWAELVADKYMQNIWRLKNNPIYLCVNTTGFPISIFLMGRALLSPLVRVPGVGGGGSNLVTSRGGTVYSSSCRHTRIYNHHAHSCAPISHISWAEVENPVKPKYKCIKWLLMCALKGKLHCLDYTRTKIQCMFPACPWYVYI